MLSLNPLTGRVEERRVNACIKDVAFSKVSLGSIVRKCINMTTQIALSYTLFDAVTEKQ